MNKTLILLAALAAGTSLYAQMDAPKTSYSVTTDFAYTSKYVFRGVQLAQDSFQPSVELGVGNFYANLWTNEPITKHENNEIDLGVGYGYKVNSALKLEAVGTYYWYPEAKGGLTRDSFETGVGAVYDYAGVTTRVMYYYDYVLKANTVSGSIGTSVPVPAIGTSLDMDAYVGTSHAADAAPDSGVTVEQSYNYCGVDLRLPYQLSQNCRFTVGGHWAANQNYVPGTRHTIFWADASISVGF